ncbi:DUF1638 domain-containing protein [Amylibacter sp. IMCC11727]|uniref:DUF1638 domain-containing protein n=1 Tax=Amylibacter sp. IMCC11727 TaxID=3039851 RepID=UPI00244DD848|nr:DUF1638 domain-containing protein [Amylibacter sp. IMCC11727]WGI20720.1 DUF1638 domain-containing protein [Amylibacter sp. IMCC11727]
MQVDDHTLSEQGLDARGSDPARVLVLACGALAREILALFKINNWDHMDLTCLPAKWHMTPDLIPAGVEDVVRKWQGEYDQIFVAYADCGTGGQLEAKCKELGVEMIAGPHCYSFFEGNEVFADIVEDEITAFYLTDFLVSVFDSFFWKPMGLDKHPELLDMYFGNYEKVVYQAQTDNPDLTAKAQECAARMGLRFERRFTGYGDLKTALAAIPPSR